MKLRPFFGTRFDADPASIGDRVAPPYDQIDDELRDSLHRTPYQFAHLSRPESADGDPHGRAATLYTQWEREGVLVTDSKPAVYPYEIELNDGRRRLGICALVGLEPPSSPIIRPHEATVEKTVDERLSLLRRMRVDIEPILFIVEDDGALNPLLESDIRTAPPIGIHRDDRGALHRLYKVDSEQRTAAYRDLLAGLGGVIADGHHRYTVAHKYAQETKPDQDSPAAMKLMVVSSLESDGLSIDPIHRGLSVPIDPSAFGELASQRTVLSPTDGAALAEAVANSDQPALAIGPVGGRFELWRFDPDRRPETLEANLASLAVGWLHRGLLAKAGLNSTNDTDGTVVYRSDPQLLFAEISDGRFPVGFWLPPMSGDEFAKATIGGKVLPPKSTRFLPKLVSGLVWASHDRALG
ncbi:MAG: DUF1015 domain-containing protein [Acidobacteriota bacterium]